MSEIIEITRHGQLKNFGFALDDTHKIGIYNHENGMWIADFALTQYDDYEWGSFINEFHEANLIHLKEANHLNKPLSINNT